MNTPFRIIDRSKRKLEKHIGYCRYMLQICQRNSNSLKTYYFKRQIELTERKLSKNQNQVK